MSGEVPAAGVLQGALLVASPVLHDPNFVRTVVLVCEHGDDGSLGVILNRPTDAPAERFLPDWSDRLDPPQVVFEGGPVRREVALALGRLLAPPSSGDWMPVVHGAGLIDLSDGPEAFTGLVDLRVFSGFAGWGSGQLEDEIAGGDWFVVDATESDLFAEDAADLWRTVLRRQPGRLAMFAEFPSDIAAN